MIVGYMIHVSSLAKKENTAAISKVGGMHAWHLVLKWANECLQNGLIFLFHVALAAFMSQKVTKLKLPA